MKVAKGLLVAGVLAAGVFAAPVPASADATPASGSQKQATSTIHAGPRTDVRVRQSSDCPQGLSCGVVEAVYALNDPTDFTSYGNYDKAVRPSADLPITGVTIHTTEGDLPRVLELYANSASYVSANIVIPGDGESRYDVITTVPIEDVAWADGNWTSNTAHISYEIVGYSALGISEHQLNVAARLAAFHGAKYGFRADPQHVIGHSAVPAQSTGGIATMHTDPGVLFNWEKFFQLTGHPVGGGAVRVGAAATVAPKWRYNMQDVSVCSGSGDVCVASGRQKTNFVYLRTEPSTSAPLISNPVTGVAGSTNIGNNAARAYYGQTFVVTAVQGDWTQLLFNGQLGWVYNPAGCRQTLVRASGIKQVTPKAGVSSVAVYGRPIPERAEFPDTLTANPLVPSYSIPTQAPLAYEVLPGQHYAAVSVPVQASHYYTWSIGDELPRLVVYGQAWYVQIQFGDRRGYVRASDVNLS